MAAYFRLLDKNTMSTTSISKKLPICVLTIAGSDSGGSAGLQADLKTFEARGVFGASVVTTVTAQDTQQVYQVYTLPESFIETQIQVVCNDLRIQAVKTGLLGRPSVIQITAAALRQHKVGQVVVDPVLVNGVGDPITPPETRRAYQDWLFPLATVITPNLDEAALLLGQNIQDLAALKAAAYQLHQRGAKGVVIKGGHLLTPDQVVDVVYDGEQMIELTAPRLPTANPHGIGCTWAAAMTAELAKGYGPLEAIRRAHAYVQRALVGSLNWQVGKGRTPVYHAVDCAVE
jgi:hydroxymethylpyrimidine kinase/phosphomethylpyrimidine kinase